MADDYYVKTDPDSIDIDSWLSKQRAVRMDEENRRLHKAVLIAAGIISTHPNWSGWHPEAVLDMLMGDDRRG